MKGEYPAGIKSASSENAKKLFDEAVAWKNSQKTAPLSSLTQDVLSGKQTLSKLPTAQQQQVRAELSESGALTGDT